MATPRERIGAIESLRALAALSILGFHAAFASDLALSSSLLKPYASRLEVGVTIFFLISGFLLYRPFVRARVLGTRRPWVARYAASRVLRIVPAYWVALAVITIWLGLSGVFTPKGIFTYFGFLQIYSPGTANGGLVQAWSLCVEVVFYAFVPLFALLMAQLPGRSQGVRLRLEWLALVAMFIVGSAWNALVLHTHDPSQASSQPYLTSFPAFIDQFALGMGVAVLATSAEARRHRWLVTLDRFPFIPILVAAIAFWAASTQIGLHGGYERITGIEWEERHLLFGLVALGLLLPAVFARPDHGWIHMAMTTRVGRWLGEISYGIYLWHLAFLIQLDHWGFQPPGGAAQQWVEWMVMAVLPTIAVAAASYHGLEQPALALRDRFAQSLADHAGRLRRRPAEPTEPEAETDIAAP